MRRPQPRDPAAFLVDQHRRLGARHRGAQVLDQPARALGRVDVAGEQDEAQRIGVAEERTLVGREVGAGAAEDDGSGWGHGDRVIRERSEGSHRAIAVACSLK